MDGDLRQCGGPRRRVGAVSDVVSPPARAGRRPRCGADDPAIRLPQDSRPALRHRAASGGPSLDGGPLRRRAAVSARGLRCRGRRHRGAHRPLRPAGGAASGPLAAAFSARHGPLGRAPGKLAGAAICWRTSPAVPPFWACISSSCSCSSACPGWGCGSWGWTQDWPSGRCSS